MNFKDKTFYYCYDCGYGEKGVLDRNLTYAEAYHVLKAYAPVWAKLEDGFYEVGAYHYMVSHDKFIEEDWEGEYYGV